MEKRNNFECTTPILLDLYFILHIAVKTNDVELYAYGIFQLTGLFFSENYHNYARWMSLHSLELVGLEKEKPVVAHLLKNGAFSVNRTGKPFSRVGVDMALEQTINAETKSRLIGIVEFADVSSAVNRWMVTTNMRMEIYCSIANMCKKFFVVDGILKVEIEDALYGCHTEADTRVMLHAKHADQHQRGNIVIRANDTYIAVISATNAKHLERSRIWINAEYDKDNSRAYIDITTLSKDIKNVEALAAIYAFTGCDYSPSFHRKGKVTPMNLMGRYPKFVEVFSKFGEV